MKKIITYGTFDLFHQGHINILKRAKKLGDYLIVGVTTENYDISRGKLNVHKSLMERIEDVKQSGYADEVIIEEFEGQKIEDIQKYNIDVFVIGSDWLGKFDYLKEYCEVVYLERTKGVSSTQLRTEKKAILQIGIIGSGRIAQRFLIESKYVSGVDVVGVFNPNKNSAKTFYLKNELAFYSSDYEDFLNRVDAVYIATPHVFHYEYSKIAILNKKHVLCEKPMVLTKKHAQELFELATFQKVVLKEAIKTAFCPAFNHLIRIVKSGTIGKIIDVEASFTMLKSGNNIREFNVDLAGGSITELASYPLLPIIKLFGIEYSSVQFFTKLKDNIDIYTRGVINYNHGVATFKVGLGAKTEGHLIITGTKGYAYVPSPWWKTDYFELRFEDLNKTQKYFYKFEGDGLRYEIVQFLSLIQNNQQISFKLTNDESIAFADIIERFRNNENVFYIQ